MILCIIKKFSIPTIVILYIVVYSIIYNVTKKLIVCFLESEDEKNPDNASYVVNASLFQIDELFDNNSPTNSVKSNTSKKNISRSNSEIDEVQECVSNKKLKVTRDTSSSETRRHLSHGFTPNNNFENENENDQGIIVYIICFCYSKITN